MSFSITDGGAEYRGYVYYIGEGYAVRGNGSTGFAPNVEFIYGEDGMFGAFLNDNTTYFCDGEVVFLNVYPETELFVGSTIRFFTGEDCTIEYWGSWANGVIPTIEPYTAYEMSIALGVNYEPCAVLVPFIYVEKD